MDNGEVIIGLNEDWNLLGAKLSEWIAGFIMFFLSGDLIFGWTYSMPLLLCIWIGTTLGLASGRKLFPDEERGLRNQFFIVCGFPPPGIPAPASIQPYWSGAPIRKRNEKSEYETLGLTKVFNVNNHESEKV